MIILTEGFYWVKEQGHDDWSVSHYAPDGGWCHLLMDWRSDDPDYEPKLIGPRLEPPT
jgi:hypothetical protein